VASSENGHAALQWQVGVWDRMSPIYLREVDDRFTEIIDGVIRRAALRPGQQVLDLGTGTGSVALKSASSVTPGGAVTAMDISPEMLRLTRQRAASMGLSNLEGRAEEIPTPSGRFDAVLASLSLMYVIDRGAGRPRDCPRASARRAGGRGGLGRP
jgi:SAM-dependent methyltransferase